MQESQRQELNLQQLSSGTDAAAPGMPLHWLPLGYTIQLLSKITDATI